MNWGCKTYPHQTWSTGKYTFSSTVVTFSCPRIGVLKLPAMFDYRRVTPITGISVDTYRYTSYIYIHTYIYIHLLYICLHYFAYSSTSSYIMSNENTSINGHQPIFGSWSSHWYQYDIELVVYLPLWKIYGWSMDNLWIIYGSAMDLVGGIPTPLKNMSSSIGMMTFPRYGKTKDVPNRQ